MTVVRVRDIAEQIRGVTFSKGEASAVREAGYIPVLTASNITDDGLQLKSLLYVPESKVAIRQRLRQGDLVVTASSGSLSVVGRAALVTAPLDAAFGAFCKVLRPNQHVEPRFLAHFFRTPSYRARVSRLAAGANINNLRNEDLDDLVVPLPPLPEQRRIADILDRADDLRAKRRRALALLDLFVESLYVAMFSSGAIGSATAVTRKLSAVAKIKSGSTPNRKHAEFFGGGIPWVKTTEVHGDLILATEESVSVEGQKAARLQLFPVGSIVIAMYGQGKTRGQSAILGIDAAVNQACAVILPSEHFVVEFMGQQIRLSYERLRAKAQGGNQANLNLGLVGDLDVLVPSIEDQRDFVQQAKLVDELRINQTLELARLDELFASLQHRAFQGEL